MTPLVRDRRWPFIVALAAVLLIGPPTPARSGAAPPSTGACETCIRIRVGVPTIVRGPAADIADNRFNEIALPNGRFRGFDAHSETRAIDGARPSDMSGPTRIVLRPGPPGSIDSCGQWLNHAERAGAKVLGFIHDETACNYPAGQTHKSMSLATSSDDGLTWHDLGRSSPAPTPRRPARTPAKATAPPSMVATASTIFTASVRATARCSWRAHRSPTPANGRNILTDGGTSLGSAVRRRA
ncbi:hypothetical protein [Bradyrhizobium genosp. P]|uniref:hypothetical protein n=1 Tax=Bradyrhizobium genosp. P TaxID=83641 RepID=UPI003CF0E68A